MTEESAQPKNNSMTRFMQPEQVLMIDEALASIGEDGEMRLVVEKGRPRFVVLQQSFSV